jgi:hypothetical protein
MGPIKLELSDPQPGAPPGIANATRHLRAIAETMVQFGLSDLGQLSLHFALERLSIARDVSDAHSVAPLLWQMALQIERVLDRCVRHQKSLGEVCALTPSISRALARTGRISKSV